MTPLDSLPVWLVLPVVFFLFIGSTLAFLGAVGLFHLQSFYDRVHTATLGTSWGTAAILLASILICSWGQGRLIIHELAIGIFIMITTPVTYMLLCRAALTRDQSEGNENVPPSPALRTEQKPESEEGRSE